MKKRIVVALSGGVDSATAAALLKARGHEVVGMTLCFNLPDAPGARPSCCGLQGIEDARRTAERLGIRHYVLNAQKQLLESVIADFCREYAQGRTPNPCVLCNQFLKFDFLLKKALAIDADYLATGHYARVEARSAGARVSGCAGSSAGGKKEKMFVLKKGKDLLKDQSYFLYRLGQEQLKRILFPLGGMTKVQVRECARRLGLPVAQKPGSQEICFISGADYRDFLVQHIPAAQRAPGDIVAADGRVLGRHKGIAFYTVGQRQGLGIAHRHPLYVTSIDARRNVIVAGSYEDACSTGFRVRSAHWIAGPPKKKIAARVKIRYNYKEQPASIIPENDTYRVRFRSPQFAVTPGQSAVFYSGTTVLGGGIIANSIKDNEFRARLNREARQK